MRLQHVPEGPRGGGATSRQSARLAWSFAQCQALHLNSFRDINRVAGRSIALRRTVSTSERSWSYQDEGSVQALRRKNRHCLWMLSRAELTKTSMQSVGQADARKFAYNVRRTDVGGRGTECLRVGRTD